MDNMFGPVDLTKDKYPAECDRCGKEIRHGFANLCIVLCGTCYVRFLRRSEAAELGWQRRRKQEREELLRLVRQQLAVL